MYYTAQWTWSRRINRIELYNEPELELCWGPTIFVQQTVIRCAVCWGGVWLWCQSRRAVVAVS